VLRAQLHSVSIVSTNLRPSTCPRRMPAARSATASTRTFTAKSAQDICLSCVYAYVCVRMRACEPTGPPLPHTPPWLPPASARCLAPARVSPSTVVALSTSLPLSLSLARSLARPASRTRNYLRTERERHTQRHMQAPASTWHIDY
jgi:hypothetical protein